MKYSTEVAVFSIQEALAAVKGGADRIELCSSMEEGGTTPSAGIISIVKKMVECEITVMIRPRGGDFFYSDEEYESMIMDILYCKNLGVDGVALGILSPNGRVDMIRCKKLSEIAKPMKTIFHRAFDMSSCLHQSLEDIVICGFNRILTSGGKKTAYDGIDTISSLIKQSEGRIVIMPGGKVRADNVREIATKTGATEFHTSARNKIQSAMKYHNPELSMSDKTSTDEYCLNGCDKDVIKQFVNTLKKGG